MTAGALTHAAEQPAEVCAVRVESGGACAGDAEAVLARGRCGVLGSVLRLPAPRPLPPSELGAASLAAVAPRALRPLRRAPPTRAAALPAGGPLKVTTHEYIEGRPNVVVEYNLEAASAGTCAFVGSHLDVVPANPETWNVNPFELTVDGAS
eukprot:COSAG01_NODE_6056_length_3876_cov_9.951019_2_plen_152_part_00